jgi:hypothetical protein
MVLRNDSRGGFVSFPCKIGNGLVEHLKIQWQAVIRNGTVLPMLC